MRSNWIVYPEAQARLNETGLAERIEDANKGCMLRIRGSTSDYDVKNLMEDGELFDAMKADERAVFKQTLLNALKDASVWRIMRKDGEQKEKIKPEDVMVLAGDSAWGVLEGSELFDFKRFGFANVLEFTGTVGAAIERAAHSNVDMREGYKWESRWPDGRVVVNSITGSMHADLRIYQNDVTPYETFDPFGNRVYYRPETDSDRRVVAAYHSTEPHLLVALLKYSDQLGLKPAALEDGAAKTIEWIMSLGQSGGSCAEHFGGGRPDDHYKFFINWRVPLPQLDVNLRADGICVNFLYTEYGGRYNIYVGQQKELVIAYVNDEQEEKLNPKKAVSFMPEEIDHLIKGVLFQSARGLGRVPGRQLIDILTYRYSEKFISDQKRFSSY